MGSTMLQYKTFPVQCKKNNEAGNSLNAVERKPVPTRVLNPTASETSYKSKQRSYRKTKQNYYYFLNIFFLNIFPNFNFFFNFWNLHGRSEIGWIERITNFQIFPIFIFWVIVILVSFFWKNHPNFRW